MKKYTPSYYSEIMARDAVVNENKAPDHPNYFARQFVPDKREERRSEAYMQYFDTKQPLPPNPKD